MSFSIEDQVSQLNAPKPAIVSPEVVALEEVSKKAMSKVSMKENVFGPSSARLDDNPITCKTIKECMDGGDRHQGYILRQGWSTKPLDRPHWEILYRHASLALEYFQQARNKGGNPGEKLFKAIEDKESIEKSKPK